MPVRHRLLEKTYIGRASERIAMLLNGWDGSMGENMRRNYLVLVSVFGLGLASTEAMAQSFPTKPLRAIVPFAAGSATDIVPRVVFEQVSAQLSQSIVVENRAGAGGTTGAGMVAKADADGHTMLANSSAHTIAPALYPNLSYHPARDFAAIAALGVSPFILVVPPSSGIKTARDLVAAAKAKPGALNFASVGIGSASHLSAERFAASAGVKAVHVPFRGGPEAMTEVMSGRIDFFFVAAGAALSHVRDGKLTALAVNSAKRSSTLPNVPTIRESGFDNADYPLWFGLFAPARTPRDIIDRLHRETSTALQRLVVKDKLAALGVDPMVLSPAEFDALVERDIANDAALVKAIGLKAE
jgi:tripartite-type tricarboxylate transporter receptor subunit TctC